MKKKKTEKPRSVWLAKVGPEAKILIKKGKLVKVGDVLALKQRKITKKIAFPFWLRSGLGTWAKGGKKIVGERVEVEGVLFEKVGFPRQKLTWISPVKGEIISLSEEKGYLEILIGQEEEKLISPVSGTVAQATKGKIEITFLAQEFLGEGFGEGVGWGKLTALEDNPLSSLNSEHKGQVLVVEEISGSLAGKGAALGVAAFISFQKLPDLQDPSLPVLIFSLEKGKKTKVELIELLGQYCFVSPAHSQVLVCLEANDE